MIPLKLDEIRTWFEEVDKPEFTLSGSGYQAIWNLFRGLDPIPGEKLDPIATSIRSTKNRDWTS